MTERYSTNIMHDPVTPDALSGMIFAMEGIRNAVVLLNGPMGCRFYHSTTSQFLSIRPLLYIPADEADENAEKVPVDYTPVKYVKKPAGARPGMVVYTTYRTAYVDPDGELAKRLDGS